MSSLAENGILADIADVMKDQLLCSPHLLLAALACGLNFLSWEYNPEIPTNTCASWRLSASAAGLLSLFLREAPNVEKKVPEDAASILPSEMLSAERVTSSAYEKVTLKQRRELKPLTWTEEGNGRHQSSLQLGVPHWTNEGSILPNYTSVLLLVPANVLHHH